jgi:hypothetical protein
MSFLGTIMETPGHLQEIRRTAVSYSEWVEDTQAGLLKH